MKTDMTLFEDFAAAALEGLCANPEVAKHHCDKPDQVAKTAYDLDDAMMRERVRRLTYGTRRW